MKSNCVFGYDQGDGLYNFQLDILKLMLEDRDFFTANINTLDQNTFSDWVLRAIAGMLKENYRSNGVWLQYDGLESMSCQFFSESFDQKMAKEYLDKIRTRTLSEDRVKEVKYCYRYWNTFYYMVRMYNKLGESLMEGKLTTLKDLEKTAYAAIEDAEVLKGIMNGEVYCGDEDTWNW